MEICTAGFAGWTAEEFFETLTRERIERLVDVRLHNTSQLAGFAKRDDLAYFLRTIVGAEYAHEELLAPTPDLLDAYRKKRIGWDEYEAEFRALMRERRIEAALDRSEFEARSVLLCSEHAPDRCHRRLVAEHLATAWGDIDIIHLRRPAE